MFQVDTDIGRNTRISLRVLFKFLFAPVTAEVIHMIPVLTGEFSIVFINYHKTDWIGCHGYQPLWPLFSIGSVCLSVIRLLWSRTHTVQHDAPPGSILRSQAVREYFCGFSSNFFLQWFVQKQYFWFLYVLLNRTLSSSTIAKQTGSVAIIHPKIHIIRTS